MASANHRQVAAEAHPLVLIIAHAEPVTPRSNPKSRNDDSTIKAKAALEDSARMCFGQPTVTVNGFTSPTKFKPQH
jgi:hypothetical protein